MTLTAALCTGSWGWCAHSRVAACPPCPCRYMCWKVGHCPWSVVAGRRKLRLKRLVHCSLRPPESSQRSAGQWRHVQCVTARVVQSREGHSLEGATELGVGKPVYEASTTRSAGLWNAPQPKAPRTRLGNRVRLAVCSTALIRRSTVVIHALVPGNTLLCLRSGIVAALIVDGVDGVVRSCTPNQRVAHTP